MTTPKPVRRDPLLPPDAHNAKMGPDEQAACRDLLSRIMDAAPGDRLVYHTGMLDCDCARRGRAARDRVAILEAHGRRVAAMRAQKLGIAVLVQERVAACRFRYIAVRIRWKAEA